MPSILSSLKSPAELEPLAKLARFTFDWAQTLCRAEHGCSLYHRAWSTMRLLDQDGASPAGWPFFRRELQRIDRGASTRILLSGSADTGLTAMVAAALPAADGARIVIAERCATTLEQNRLFAYHLRREFELHQGDVRQLQCAPVDAVIAHTFLVYFDRDAQRDVMSAWARCLKPGGVALISNRLAPAHLPPRVPTGEAVIAARLPEVIGHARSLGWSAGDLDELSDVARQFWRLPPSQAITEQQMRENLAQAGLELVSLEYDDAEPTGPMSRRHKASGYRRAEIVARKPG